MRSLKLPIGVKMGLMEINSGRDVPNEINVIIEIPMHGEPVKYEVDKNAKLASFDDDSTTYELTKFLRTNQNTIINLIPIVKKGDKVITIGGIHGVVTSTKEKTIVIKVDDSTKIEFSRSAVSSVVVDEKAKEKNSEKVGFDRGRFKFHGKVKALADGAREGGLIF